MMGDSGSVESVCLQADIALGQNGLVQSLVEEVKRRMHQLGHAHVYQVPDPG